MADDEDDTLAMLAGDSEPSGPANADVNNSEPAAAEPKEEKAAIEDEEDTLALLESNVAPAVALPTQWFYQQPDGQVEGPLTADDLRDLFDEGQLTDETFVWSEHTGDWQRLKEVPHLHAKMHEELVTGHEKKRRARKEAREKRQKGKKRPRSPPKNWFTLDTKKNTNVYITNLPPDATVPEVFELFKKAGVIKIDPLTKMPRIKLYKDKRGNNKGDGLVSYLKPDSVMLAVKLLDETPFRPTWAPLMRVEQAQFQQKGEQYVPKDTTQLREAAKKQAKQHERMFGWHEVGDENPRVVILHNMFHPDDFGNEVNLKREMLEDLMAECGKLGTVEKIKIFQNHPQGIVSVRFADSFIAQECIKRFDGRMYAGRRLSADIWDYKTDYRVEELQAEEDERFERFGDDDDDDDVPVAKRPPAPPPLPADLELPPLPPKPV
eukprot:TRINITY_DN19694_c0_g1_i1.p1 TRINITY_DN19694_c0_g1~~TRINITY_DN19694_c0_g1_i1.p1  ORF type:complete len:436 (-),score=98.01 TRINITY_DN19694_c0_g1_i1:28-1335(-)